jgi:beta-N-acetylhexosaminidase
VTPHAPRAPASPPWRPTGPSTTLADRKRRAGQRLFLGFDGLTVSDDLRRLARDIQPGGFILFGRNVAEPLQVRELCRELDGLLSPEFPPLRLIDQEGGRVQRVRAPATVWPAARVVARAGLTREVSHALALELAAMSLDLNLAPVADVDSNPANPVIGDRSPASTADEVARHVLAALEGHEAAGIGACVKHFPGHGDTHLDSHLDLPVVEVDLPELRHRELVPFEAAVRAGASAVMSAHVVFPALDEDWPATLSPRLIPAELRQRMGFQGVVFSDDLEMKAVAGRWEVPVIARQATHATVDGLLACHDPALQVALFEALVQQQEETPALHRANEDAAARIHALRRAIRGHLRRRPGLEVVGCAAHQELADRARERGS